MTDLDRLKERIPIVDVLERVGAEFPDPTSIDDELPFFCPFCDDKGSGRPAGRANPLKGLWHCWSCGRGGTVIDVAMEHLRGTEAETYIGSALTWLLVEFPEEEVLLDPWADGAAQ